MSARTALLAGAIVTWAWLATPAAAQLAGPFCLTFGEPAEAMTVFVSSGQDQILGTGVWLRRPVSVAGALVEGSAHLSLTLPAFPPSANPLSCGAVLDLATGQGPARCARFEGSRIDGTLAGVGCVPPVSPPDRVFVLGHPMPAQQVVSSLAGQGFLTRVNGELVLGGTALFTVSALDGPMPQLREALDRLAGDDASRGAIVVVDVPLLDDAELLELVILETRELVARYVGEAAAQALPVLRTDLPGFAAAVGALAPAPLVIAAR
jgi:hypothetical protein